MANSNAHPSQTVPPWMSEVKEDATKTNEWNELSKHIYDAVEQHMSQSHVNYFTDLTEAEKNLLLERAARSLATADGGHVYENLQSKLSYLLDQSVNNQVAKKMLEDSPLDTKTDLVLDTTSEGIITLLRKHPDQKYKLRIFLNQVVPPPIRFLAMQLFFGNSNFRKVFINKLSTNTKLCLSPQDIDIQRRCDSLLNSSMLYREVNDSKGNMNSMKGILSYYHTTLNNKRALNDSELFYAVPIVYAHYPPLAKNESPTERSMSILIEIYQQFIQTMPYAIIQSLNGFNDNPEMELLVRNTITILEQYDMPLVDTVRELARLSSAPGIEDITFQTAFKSVCSPMIRNLFGGYLSMAPLMFVWDQYTISADITGYHDELIPIMTAIVLMILRDQLIYTKSIGEFDECLKRQAGYIQTRQLQTVLNKYFFKTLQAKINMSSRVGPVIDPTVGRLQPWEHWHQDVVPRRTLRSRELDDTDERLKNEINRRLQSEKMAKEEIERLRRELEMLKMRSVNPAPVPTRMPRQLTPVEQPIAATKRDSVKKQPVVDILSKMKASLDKIAHGENADRKKLDAQTNEDLKLHKLDLKIAEKEVFGHQIKPSEWDALDNQEKQIKSQKMLMVVKSRLEKRYRENSKR